MPRRRSSSSTAVPAGRTTTSSPPPPLVVLHGGPGGTHDYLLSLADLADLADRRAVIHYDQVGNGRSTHYPDRGAEFWTVELFVRELHNLVDALGIRERHHVLGQSWGGFLAEEYALTQPPGLRALVLADTAASWADFASEAGKLRDALPEDVRATLDKHEAAGTYDDPEYVEACLVFYGRHVCRIPWPAEVAATFEWLERNPVVYRTMNGPSEFHIIGSCKDWQIKDRLHEIRRSALIVSGRYDEATPASRSRRTCRTSRSASATCRSSAAGSPSTTDHTAGLSSGPCVSTR